MLHITKHENGLTFVQKLFKYSGQNSLAVFSIHTFLIIFIILFPVSLKSKGSRGWSWVFKVFLSRRKYLLSRLHLTFSFRNKQTHEQSLVDFRKHYFFTHFVHFLLPPKIFSHEKHFFSRSRFFFHLLASFENSTQEGKTRGEERKIYKMWRLLKKAKEILLSTQRRKA